METKLQRKERKAAEKEKRRLLDEKVAALDACSMCANPVDPDSPSVPEPVQATAWFHVLRARRKFQPACAKHAAAIRSTAGASHPQYGTISVLELSSKPTDDEMLVAEILES